MLISRVGIALSHAIFWSITAAIAIRVAPEGKKALALSVLATGTSLAMVLGVPLGRLVGQWFGWRATFGGIGVIAFIVFILQARLLPTLPSMFEGSFRKIPELLKNPLLVCLYLLILLVFTAHYTAYSYIEPFMRQVGAISENAATVVLLLFGVAGIAGSVIFSRWGDRFNTQIDADIDHINADIYASAIVCRDLYLGAEFHCVTVGRSADAADYLYASQSHHG